MRKWIYILLLLLISVSVFSETDKELQHTRQKRFQWIHVHHLGLGIETNMYENFHISPRIFYSFGSFRNIVNVDGGIKYIYAHPMMHIEEEKIAGHYISPFVGATINFGRWNNGCIYAGGEVAYNFAISGDHYFASGMMTRDNHICNQHCSVRVKLGLKFEEWEFNIHYEYDFSPAWNQKYIFESADYDYDLLRPTLFERYRFGIHIAYLLPF